MRSIELTRIGARRPSPGYASNGGVEEQPDSFHFLYNTDTEEVTRAIIEAVAFIHNTSYEELTPLGSVVDIDALTEVLDADSESIEVRFSYESLAVTVNSEGDIWLQWV